jgi:hypothetical protein
VSVHVDTRAPAGSTTSGSASRAEFFPLTPGGIIKYLDLRRPIYRKTAAGGHFGRSEPDFTWELATGLFLLAVSLPGSAPLAISASWFLWTAGEAVAWTMAGRSPPRFAARPAASVSSRASATVSPSAPAGQLGEEAECEEIPEGLVQRLERVASDDGETVYALLRVPLEAGSRLGVAHLAFCPPLARVPKLAGGPRDEWASDVRVTAAETYGARLEIRLDRPAKAGEAVLVEIWSEA